MRPSGLRPTSSPFVRPKKKSGSQKLGFDLDRIEPSNNHKQRIAENLQQITFLRRELMITEAAGRWSKARKIRRSINQALEEELFIRNSWCGGCLNYLHNCICRSN